MERTNLNHFSVGTLVTGRLPPRSSRNARSPLLRAFRASWGWNVELGVPVRRLLLPWTPLPARTPPERCAAAVAGTAKRPSCRSSGLTAASSWIWPRAG
jgi:hypothetical protein